MKTASQRIAIGMIAMMVVQGVVLHKAAYAQAAQTSQEAGGFSLPDGKVGQGYEYQLRTEGGLPPVTWRVVGGELPPGIGFEASGRIKGVPTAPRRQAYSFVVEVSDSSQPSQRAEESYLLKIEAAPLRIVDGTSKLRIVPQVPAAQDSSERRIGNGSTKRASISTETSTETKSASQPPTLSWPAVSVPGPTYRTETMGASQDNPGTDTKVTLTGEELNPAYFVQVFEVPKARSGTFHAASTKAVYGENVEIYGKLIYDGHTPGLNNTRLTADESSTIVVRPNVGGRDIAFNTIYMAAELSSGDTKQNLEVVNYSEVGVAPTADAFVVGASFETAKNILDKLITLQRRSTDILKYVLGTDDKEISTADLDKLIRIDQDADAVNLRNRAKDAFQQYAPEVESIAGFLLTQTNRNIVERIANTLFHMDRDTLIAISKQFTSDVALIGTDAATRDPAIRRLLSRTVQLYKDFTGARAEIRYMVDHGGAEGKDHEDGDRTRLVKKLNEIRERIQQTTDPDLKLALKRDAGAVARDIYAYDRSIEAITNLRQTKFPVGWVSLDEARSRDGDTLKLTVRVQNPGSAGTGNKVPFYIAVKRYGVKLHWASSFMFIKRLDITAADLVPDANGNTLSEVNFAPSPGVSYGFTYFKRGDTGGSKFLRTLAPTVGINVSFMNFKDPGFDLLTNMFTNTKGTDVQVGTGPIVSLFNNKLHFIPVGWNLNADRKRRYWGIGFGFVEFAKELGKYIKN